MSIWGAFANSSAAMIAFSRGMDSISQNIANVATTGYKRSDIRFKEMLSESTPAADIFGVDTAHRNLISQQGVTTPSARWSDLAINGDGFFVLNTALDGSGETLFSRNGAFTASAGDDGNTYLTGVNGNYLMGWTVSPDGTAAAGGALSPVALDHDEVHLGAATTWVQPVMNIDAGAEEPQTVSVGVFDAGTPDDGDENLLEHGARAQQLELAWTSAAPNEWDVTITAVSQVPDANGNIVQVRTPILDSAGQPVTHRVSFDGDGRLRSPATPIAFTVDWPHDASGSGSTPVTVSLDLSAATQFDGASQVLTVDQNGVGPGVIKDFSFDSDGVLWGNFSNGRSEAKYKLPIGTFTAPDALEVRDGGLFAATAAAGDLTLREVTGLEGGAAFVPQALEASTVDLADEFTRMIITQRAYSSAATVFRTSDEMTTLARDLMR